MEVTTRGQGYLFCVVLQKVHQVQWKRAVDFTGEECCRLSSHHGCFPCYYICFIFGDRINDSLNEYWKLPLFFSLIGKIKAFSKSCMLLFCEVTTWFLSPILPGYIHHAQWFFFCPRDSIAECVRHPAERTPTCVCAAQLRSAGFAIGMDLEMDLGCVAGIFRPSSMKGRERLVSPFCAKMKSKWCTEKWVIASALKFLEA